MMDSCAAHRGLEFDCLCAATGAVTVSLPPHSLNHLQMLDSTIFLLNKLETAHLQSDCIVVVLDGFITATALVQSYKFQER
jgi:hypothetical protein